MLNVETVHAVLAQAGERCTWCDTVAKCAEPWLRDENGWAY